MRSTAMPVRLETWRMSDETSTASSSRAGRTRLHTLLAINPRTVRGPHTSLARQPGVVHHSSWRPVGRRGESGNGRERCSTAPRPADPKRGAAVIITASVTPAPLGGTVRFTEHRKVLRGCGLDQLSVSGTVSCHCRFASARQADSHCQVLGQFVRPTGRVLARPSSTS
jgi:hypothetical protein